MPKKSLLQWVISYPIASGRLSDEKKCTQGIVCKVLSSLLQLKRTKRGHFFVRHFNVGLSSCLPVRFFSTSTLCPPVQKETGCLHALPSRAKRIGFTPLSLSPSGNPARTSLANPVCPLHAKEVKASAIKATRNIAQSSRPGIA